MCYFRQPVQLGLYCKQLMPVGCPYKLFPDAGLQAKLRKIGISEKGVREIAAKAKNGDFQVRFDGHRYPYGHPLRATVCVFVAGGLRGHNWF